MLFILDEKKKNFLLLLQTNELFVSDQGEDLLKHGGWFQGPPNFNAVALVV